MGFAAPDGLLGVVHHGVREAGRGQLGVALGGREVFGNEGRRLGNFALRHPHGGVGELGRRRLHGDGVGIGPGDAGVLQSKRASGA